MPGHVKKTSGPDEDPCPYLVVTLDMKRENAMKPYDPKKSYWSPDGKGNYMECMLVDDDGNKATVMCGHEVIGKPYSQRCATAVVTSFGQCKFSWCPYDVT
jgi:hypothetical protein